MNTNDIVALCNETQCNFIPDEMTIEIERDWRYPPGIVIDVDKNTLKLVDFMYTCESQQSSKILPLDSKNPIDQIRSIILQNRSPSNKGNVWAWEV